MKSFRRFNAPREMAARLGCLMILALVFASALLLLQACVMRSPLALAGSALALAGAGLIRKRLLKNGGLARSLRSLLALDRKEDEPELEETEASAHFADLLDERDRLEARRGTPGFDPWALSSLQHEIGEALRLHPEFIVLQRAHAPALSDSDAA